MPYIPGELPEAASDADVRMYLTRELQKISVAVNLLEQGRFPVLHVAPAKPRQGMLAYADGTDWNPGAGEGYYEFDGTSWTKL